MLSLLIKIIFLCDLFGNMILPENLEKENKVFHALIFGPVLCSVDQFRDNLGPKLTEES